MRLISILYLFILLPAGLVGAGEDWRLVWSDEFAYSGEPDPSKWDYDLGGGGWGNNERQVYTKDPANVRVEDGHLLIQVQQEQEGTRTPTYTSARIVTREKRSLQYGRVEVRAQLPSETGTWSAIWMLPTDALLDPVYWPNNGEIDIVEHVGYEEDPLFLAERGVDTLENVHSTVHTDRRNGMENTGIGDRVYVADASTSFHIYALNWYPDRLEFYVDDTNILTLRRDEDMGLPLRNRPEDISPWWPFDQRFHLIMNIAVGGNWGGHFNSNWYPNSPYGTDGINHGGDWPQTLAVDYVRIYEPADRKPPSGVAPGTLSAADYAGEYGILLEHGDEATGPLTVHGIDAGDWLEYELYAAAEGAYGLELQLSGILGDRRIEVENQTNGHHLLATLDTAAGTSDWTWVGLGDLEMVRGLNRIRIHFPDAGVDVAFLRVQLPMEATWKSLPFGAPGVADTGGWLGPVGTSGAPWLYVPRVDAWLYTPSVEAEVLSTANDWIFLHIPEVLESYGTGDAPWYYSTSLHRWYYVDPAPTDGHPAWVFLY